MGIRRIVKDRLLSVLAAGVAIPLLFPSPAAAQADKTAPGGKPSIEILAPVAGAVIPPGKVLVIGRVRGTALPSVEIDVNGKSHHKAVSSVGGFMASVYLTRGKNVLSVHADGLNVERTILGADAVNYKYHPEVEKCGGCHADVAKGYVVSGRRDTVCYQCHDRKDGKRLVHGPLGGGDCTTCHDPHGAMNPALTLAAAEGLCVKCHDQPHSAKHMRESKAVGCVTCHEPHSSGKEFLQK